MECPLCRSVLEPIEYEGALIHECRACGGEFMGGDSLAHIVRTRETRVPADVAAGMATAEPFFGVPASEARRVVDCPACRAAMEVANYSGDTAVFVDRCPGCGGMWLDRDELEQIQALTERWADEAPQRVQAIAEELETARRAAAAAAHLDFPGSRFAFVSAVLGRFFDAA